MVVIVIVVVAPFPLTTTEAGLIEQVICVLVDGGWQVRSTVPLKPAIGSRTICEVADWPGAAAVATAPKKEKSELGVSPAHAFARLVTFTEPSQLTWSYPTPALKPY